MLTDLEFYELRYSGKGAAFLRGFRAFYLGAVFNVLIMASVCLAGIKIGGALLGLSPVETLLISCGITVIYSSIGGLRGIIITDFFQFILAMLATFWAAYEIVSLPQIQGLTMGMSISNYGTKMKMEGRGRWKVEEKEEGVKMTGGHKRSFAKTRMNFDLLSSSK